MGVSEIAHFVVCFSRRGTNRIAQIYGNQQGIASENYVGDHAVDQKHDAREVAGKETAVMDVNRAS